MGKPTKQASGRGASSRGKSAGRSSKSEGEVFAWISRSISGFFGHVSTNYRNRRIPVVLGLCLLAFMTVALFSVLTFLLSKGSDQSLIAPLAEGEVLEESSRSTANLFGIPGARLADYLFNRLLGWGIFFLFAYALYFIYHLIWRPGERILRYISRFLLLGFLSLWTAIAMSALQHAFPSDTFLVWGGAQGVRLYYYIQDSVGSAGLVVILGFSLLIFAVLCNDRVLRTVQSPSISKPQFKKPSFLERIEALFKRKGETEYEAGEDEDTSALQDEDAWRDELKEEGNLRDEEEEPFIQPTPQTRYSYPEHGDEGDELQMIVEQAPQDDLVEDNHLSPEPTNPGVLLALYQKPSTELLRDYEQGSSEIDMQEIELNKQRIIDTLASFKMRVTPMKATVGPTVTLYEVVPDSGIKVSRIKTMEDDIAMSLKSEGVRIIAPMPGQGTIGIEVPNSLPQTVSMRSILASRKFKEQQEKMELPIGIGKTITNEPFIFDLTKMPHLLIAGATGQGKSVGLNALITSLLYSKRPEELKFVMVDPKMLEFSIYEEIEKHFLAKLPDSDKAIITDMSRVVATLNSLCIEMDNRYHLLQHAGRAVRNIKEYNEQVRSGELRRIDGHEILPYIVLIVDEFADLMMTVGKEVEQPIARLAQKARAAGIHMVIATQRPSTDVITGLIKANFPARIAFKVFSMVDSRTVLDSPGANQLIGRGDMLFYQGKEMVRVQCAFMDTPETEAIVSHIAHQESTGSALILPEYVPEGEDGGAKTFNPNEKDSLFDEVARMVVQTQVGSTSNIQRKFNIGYNRAGRLMDQLEGAGIVGPQEGSKPREVFIKDQISLEELLQRL